MIKNCRVCCVEFNARGSAITCSVLCSKENKRIRDREDCWENRERNRLRAAEWNKKVGAAYRAANREKINDQCRAYRFANREKVRERSRISARNERLIVKIVKQMGLLTQEDLKCL